MYCLERDREGWVGGWVDRLLDWGWFVFFSRLFFFSSFVLSCGGLTHSGLPPSSSSSSSSSSPPPFNHPFLSPFSHKKTTHARLYETPPTHPPTHPPSSATTPSNQKRKLLLPPTHPLLHLYQPNHLLYLYLSTHPPTHPSYPTSVDWARRCTASQRRSRSAALFVFSSSRRRYSVEQ